MLRPVAEGVLVHQSEFCQSNAVVVQGRAGVLLIDPGVLGTELAAIASDLRALGQPVVAGFSTHPHWDHLLWHADFGAAPRYGTARHAALLIEDRGVLVAGDMLSDVLIPMLDVNGAGDPVSDYLAGLQLLEGAAGGVEVLIPGHGSVGEADQVRARIDQDRAYVAAVRDVRAVSDPRMGPAATYGWVAHVHTGQLNRLARGK